jgi:hypothetical protein
VELKSVAIVGGDEVLVLGEDKGLLLSLPPYPALLVVAVESSDDVEDVEDVNKVKKELDVKMEL